MGKIQIRPIQYTRPLYKHQLHKQKNPDSWFLRSPVPLGGLVLFLLPTVAWNAQIILCFPLPTIFGGHGFPLTSILQQICKQHFIRHGSEILRREGEMLLGNVFNPMQGKESYAGNVGRGERWTTFLKTQDKFQSLYECPVFCCKASHHS